MGVKITDLSIAGNITGEEIAVLVQSGSSVQASIDKLLNYRKPVTITGSSYTISDRGLAVLEVNVGTSTITLPDLASWAGKKILIRKISGTAGTVTIQRAGSDTITRGGKASITLTSEGDFWELYAGSNHWELVNGYEIDGDCLLTYDGVQIASGVENLGSCAALGSGTYSDPYRTNVSSVAFDRTFSSITSYNFSPSIAGTSAAERAVFCAASSVTTSQISTLQAFRGTSNSGATDVECGYEVIGRWYA